MIRAETATPKDIERILGLYQEICGGQIQYVHLESVCEALRANNRFFLSDGYRIGSKWDMHSKLRFRVEDSRVVATMYENFDPKDRRDDNPYYVAALEAAERFRLAVLDL